MYSLTDFSLKELRVLNDVVQSSISEKVDEANLVRKHFNRATSIKRDVLIGTQDGVEELRTWSIQIHNAIDIVKQRETTHAN